MCAAAAAMRTFGAAIFAVLASCARCAAACTEGRKRIAAPAAIAAGNPCATTTAAAAIIDTAYRVAAVGSVRARACRAGDATGTACTIASRAAGTAIGISSGIENEQSQTSDSAGRQQTSFHEIFPL